MHNYIDVMGKLLKRADIVCSVELIKGKLVFRGIYGSNRPKHPSHYKVQGNHTLIPKPLRVMQSNGDFYFCFPPNEMWSLIGQHPPNITKKGNGSQLQRCIFSLLGRCIMLNLMQAHLTIHYSSSPVSSHKHGLQHV